MNNIKSFQRAVTSMKNGLSAVYNITFNQKRASDRIK